MGISYVNHKDDYFKYLIGLACDEEVAEDYKTVLRAMYNYDFYYYVSMDKNRVSDAIWNLRNPYFGDDGLTKIGQVKVLEVLIALAMRVADHIRAEGMPETQEIFRTMLENLGLMAYSDEVMTGPRSVSSRAKVTSIIHDFVHRKYDAHGNGSIFPLVDPPFESDLSKVDLWYQAMWYLTEKFDYLD